MKIISIFLFFATYLFSESVTFSFIGDCTLGSDVYTHSFDSVASKNPSEYFFSNVAEIFKKDDLTIANLETAITTCVKPASKEFRFKGKPGYLKILIAGNIDVVNLSNNHTFDYGREGYEQTMKYLKKYGIRFFDIDHPLILTVKSRKFVFLGALGSQIPQLLPVVATYKDSGTVIVTLHWGIEHTYQPTMEQMQKAYELMNAGASLIIGHHPHVLQTIEEFKGKYIIYSLGNFCFGGNKNPKDKRSMIAQITFDGG
jgi:poly-gamma-glutamate synthesis protein (capsule biosynthesis protein)